MTEPKKLSSEALAEIRERRAKITSPPWQAYHRVSPRGAHRQWHIGNKDGLCQITMHGYERDYDFIAHAPTDIDSLLSHIAALEGERDHAVAQSQANLDSWQKALDSFNQAKVAIAESTRTLLIEVVKGKHEEFAPLGIARKVCNEIIAALEAAELKQDSESVKMKAQT